MAHRLMGRDVIKAYVVPWEKGEYGVAYRIRGSKFQEAERVGSQAEAKALVEQLLAKSALADNESTNTPFPKDIAAS